MLEPRRPALWIPLLEIGSDLVGGGLVDPSPIECRSARRTVTQSFRAGATRIVVQV